MIKKTKTKIKIPLLKDHHNHLSFYALLYGCLNLQLVKEKNDALEQINRLDKNTVTVVLGWNNGYYEFTGEDLNRMPPVIIVNLSLHRFIMSPTAEERLKEKYPDVVANYRDPVWYEDHFPGLIVFLAGMPEPTEEKIGLFFDAMMKKGVYHVEDMLLPNEAVFSVIHKSLYAERTALWVSLATYKTLSEETRKNITGIKLFTDGALGARTAAINSPYLDGKKGELLFSDDAIYGFMKEAASYKKAVAVHAIGEMATTQVTRVARKLKIDKIEFPQIRMEHCQYIDEQTAREAKELGIVLSMQPNFNTDSIDYKDRLTPRYLENNNPFRMLIDKAGFVPGEDMIFGSDGMPHGVEFALNASLFPPYPGQKLTLDEFIAGYCVPDDTHGQIELEIDENTKTIECRIV